MESLCVPMAREWVNARNWRQHTKFMHIKYMRMVERQNHRPPLNPRLYDQVSFLDLACLERGGSADAGLLRRREIAGRLIIRAEAVFPALSFQDLFETG